MELPGASGFQRCLEALHAAFPALRVDSALPIDGGWANYVLEINGELIFRFPRRSDIRIKVATELRLLPELSKVVPLPIPSYDYIAENTDGRGPMFVGYPKIPGQPMFFDESTSTARRKVAEQLGSFISALHRFPVAIAVASGILSEHADAWYREYEDRYRKVTQLILPLLKPTQRSNVATAWEAFLSDRANFAFTPVFVHRDLGGDNVLWDPTNGVITGVIDWEAASIGDPAIDFANDFNIAQAKQRAFADMILLAYDGVANDRFRERVHFYFQEGPIHAVLFGLGSNQQRLVDSGLKNLEEMYCTPS